MWGQNSDDNYERFEEYLEILRMVLQSEFLTYHRKLFDAGRVDGAAAFADAAPADVVCGWPGEHGEAGGEFHRERLGRSNHGGFEDVLGGVGDGTAIRGGAGHDVDAFQRENLLHAASSKSLRLFSEAGDAAVGGGGGGVATTVDRVPPSGGQEGPIPEAQDDQSEGRGAR
jgi:hypothetical protein